MNNYFIICLRLGDGILIETQLSKKDFDRVNWQDIISNCDIKECINYSQEFLSQVGKDEYDEDINAKAVFEILSFLTMPYIDHGGENQYTLSSYFDRISESNLEILKELIPDISDAEMKSRIADLLWIKKTEYKCAIIAINSYIESAKVLEDPEMWPPCFYRIKRAVGLAASLGKNNYYLKESLNHIENLLDKYDGNDSSFLSIELLNLLQERKHGSIEKYTALSKKIALLAEDEHNWWKAYHAWNTKAKWHRLAQENVEERDSLLNLVETYVKNATDDLQKTPPDYMNACGRLEDAIQELRTIGSEDERIKELHELLLEYQPKCISQMRPIQSEFSISEEQNRKAKDFVRGKTALNAIYSIASISSSPSMLELATAAERVTEKSISQLFSRKMINGAGKTTGKTGSVFSNDEEEKEKATKDYMFRTVKFFHLQSVVGIIEPARIQINEEHNAIQVEDLLPIVSNNPFVPKGRENIYALGLYFGLKGDFLTSIHLLIPQLENSIRFVLYNNGTITSGFDQYGIQNEFDINSTLIMKELTSIIPEDIIFDLRGLLIERNGSNLRNRMAHGLIDYEEYISLVEIEYVWWLILNLCYLWKTSSVSSQDETIEQ